MGALCCHILRSSLMRCPSEMLLSEKGSGNSGAECWTQAATHVRKSACLRNKAMGKAATSPACKAHQYHNTDKLHDGTCILSATTIVNGKHKSHQEALISAETLYMHLTQRHNVLKRETSTPKGLQSICRASAVSNDHPISQTVL